MSGSVNKAILVGRLTADPEVRRLNSGIPVVNLRVVTNETWRDKNTGERKEKAEFHQVCIFNENLAKVAEQYLRKGAKVYVEGQLQTRKWQTSDGHDRYSTEVVLQAFRGELQMLDKIGSNDDAEREQAEKRSRQQSYGEASGGRTSYGDPAGDLDQDSIPF